MSGFGAAVDLVSRFDRIRTWGWIILAAFLVAGCSRARNLRSSVKGDSAVLIGEQPASLAWIPSPGSALTLRSTYEPGRPRSPTKRDATTRGCRFGTVRRLPGSRIPDFRTNSLYGQEEFDHSKFPDSATPASSSSPTTPGPRFRPGPSSSRKPNFCPNPPPR